MKKILSLLLLAGLGLGLRAQTTIPPLRMGNIATFLSSKDIPGDYIQIETDGVIANYKRLGTITVGDTESDSVLFHPADSSKWKLLATKSPTATAWSVITGKPTIYSTPAALKAALESLSGSFRLDTSAIKNLKGITTESDPNVGSHIKSISTGDISTWNAKYGTGSAVKSALEGLSGASRLSWTALKDVPAESDPNVGSHIKAILTGDISSWNAKYGTPLQVRTALESFTGTNRLDASYIKNLPSAVDISGKADLNSPTFVGTPLVPTAAIYTNTTQIASTAFVNTISATKVSFKTVSELKAFTSTDVTNNPRVYITDSGKEGEFRYVSGSSASDNTGTMLVTTSGGYRFERVVSGNILPEWFGAAGDGSTYDTTPIQNALNYAASIGAGAVVQLSAKNYKVTTLTIPDSVKLIGHDTKLTQVRANGTAVPVITCGNNTTISGLNIVCDPVSNVYANNGGIYIFNKNNVSISDCYVKNHGVFGVMIDRGKNVTVRNNRFWTNNHLSDINSSGGTVWSNSSDIFIYTDGGGYTENVLIHGNKCNSPFTSQGIWVNGVGYEKNIIISNNICATTNEDGSVWTSTNYWLDSGSGFTRRHGIVASYQSTSESGAILITGNICKTTIVTGIYVSGVGGGKGVNVTGNTCIDNGYTTNSDRSLAGGIAVTGSTGLAHIVGNTVIDFKANSTECGAINVQRNLGNNTVHNVYIADNSIINSAGVGYRIQTSSDNVTINGGIVRNSGLNDVYYNNYSTSSSNIDNWLRIKNLTITRNNITSRSVYVDATANKKIEIDGVSIKSIDSTTNNGTNSGICVINPYQPVKITNCIFDNMYDGIFIPTGSITGRRKNLIISNNYFLNLSYAVYADCDYGAETIILGTHNRYEGIISGLNRFTNYGAYFEGEEMRNDYSVTMSLSNISMSSGTWVKGDRISIDYPTSGNPYLKVVQTSGTFGTLSGVTGSITSGTKSLVVSSSSNIREGMYINIAGVTGTKRVVSVVGTTVIIDTAAGSTVTGAGVSYQAPSIITAITLP